MLRKILRRGADAKHLFDNRVFRTAVREVRRDLLDEITKTKIRDKDGREQLYLAVRALDNVVDRVKNYINAADYESQLRKAELKKKAKS